MQNAFGSPGGMFDKAGVPISAIQAAVAPTRAAVEIFSCTRAISAGADQGELETKCWTFWPATPACRPMVTNVRFCGNRSRPLR